jgi:hypothetical protein
MSQNKVLTTITGTGTGIVRKTTILQESYRKVLTAPTATTRKRLIIAISQLAIHATTAILMKGLARQMSKNKLLTALTGTTIIRKRTIVQKSHS